MIRIAYVWVPICRESNPGRWLRNPACLPLVYRHPRSTFIRQSFTVYISMNSVLKDDNAMTYLMGFSKYNLILFICVTLMLSTMAKLTTWNEINREALENKISINFIVLKTICTQSDYRHEAFTAICKTKWTTHQTIQIERLDNDVAISHGVSLTKYEGFSTSFIFLISLLYTWIFKKLPLKQTYK